MDGDGSSSILFAVVVLGLFCKSTSSFQFSSWNVLEQICHYLPREPEAAKRLYFFGYSSLIISYGNTIQLGTKLHSHPIISMFCVFNCSQALSLERDSCHPREAGPASVLSCWGVQDTTSFSFALKNDCCIPHPVLTHSV